MTATISYPLPVGAILAGGAGRRLGGATKATLKLAGGSLLGHVRHRLTSQTQVTVLCVAAAHVDAPWARASALPIVTDDIENAGPLAGIAAALHWTQREYPLATHVLTVPVDCPFLPDDLAARLTAGADGTAVHVATSGGQQQHAVALWPVSMADDLTKAVDAGMRRISDWHAAHPTHYVDWPVTPHDPFFNINTPDDLARARGMAEHLLLGH